MSEDLTGLTVNTALSRAREFILRAPDYSGSHKGCGIVVCGGGVKYFTCAWVLIKLLRHLGCGLPIQLWHLGDDELNDEMRDLVRRFGVQCVDGLNLRETHPARILRGWELKPYAIIHCPFRE